MKNKKLKKKLVLRRNTIAHLGRVKMQNIRGGDTIDGFTWTCMTCKPTACPDTCPTDPTTTTGNDVTCVSFCVTDCLCTPTLGC